MEKFIPVVLILNASCFGACKNYIAQQRFISLRNTKG